MRLTLCGTGGGAFTAARASSGYVLQADGRTIMLDCGPGSVREAMRAGISPRDIEAVVLSHLHEDHCIDLASIAFQAMYGRYPGMPPIIGPVGTREVAARFMTMYRSSFSVPAAEVTEVAETDEREVCGFRVHTEETPHATDLRAYARRFESDGRSLVFSGDTAANPDLMHDLARDTDLLLHECFSRAGLERHVAPRSPEAAERTLRNFPTTHSDVRDVARIAADAGAKRLVLTHLLPPEEEQALREEAAGLYHGELILARDGLVIDL